MEPTFQLNTPDAGDSDPEGRGYPHHLNVHKVFQLYKRWNHIKNNIIILSYRNDARVVPNCIAVYPTPPLYSAYPNSDN